MTPFGINQKTTHHVPSRIHPAPSGTIRYQPTTIWHHLISIRHHPASNRLPSGTTRNHPAFNRHQPATIWHHPAHPASIRQYSAPGWLRMRHHPDHPVRGLALTVLLMAQLRELNVYSGAHSGGRRLSVAPTASIRAVSFGARSNIYQRNASSTFRKLHTHDALWLLQTHSINICHWGCSNSQVLDYDFYSFNYLFIYLFIL